MSIKRYTTGFVLSLLLTLLAFGLVVWHVQLGHEFPSHAFLYPTVVGLALLQLIIQVVCFLHLPDPRGTLWGLVAFVFAIIVIVIVIGGTLWIMSNTSHMHETTDTPYIGNIITPQTSND